MEVLDLYIDKGSRCFVVGDVAGHFSGLSSLIDKVDFNPNVDKVVLNGNFLGYTPSSRQALAWMRKSWVVGLMGPNEAAILHSLQGRSAASLAGQWLDLVGEGDRKTWIAMLEALPVALEVRSDVSHVVVSNCPLKHSKTWQEQRNELESWNGQAPDVYKLFEGRLMGLSATGRLSTQHNFFAEGEPISLSSFHMENPAKAVVRKGRYVFLTGSAHMHHGDRYEQECLLPFVELSSLESTNNEEKICHGSMGIKPR